MATPEWKFVLVNSNDLSQIGELYEATGKSLSLGLNKPGSASFTYPFSGRLAADIEPIAVGIIAYRRGSTGQYETVWSGYVNEVNDDAETEKISVSCVGWFERLNNRIAKQEVLYTSQYDQDIIFGTGMTTPSSATGPTCPSGILQLANLETMNPDGPQVLSKTIPSGTTVTPLFGAGDAVTAGQNVIQFSPAISGVTYMTSSVTGFIISVNGTKNTPYTYTASGTFNLAVIGYYYSIPSGSFPTGVGAYPLPKVASSVPDNLTLIASGTYASGTTITPSAAATRKSFKIEQDQSFGEAITSLTAQENGPDIDVVIDDSSGQPIRKLNVYRKKGSKKENIYFAYNWGPSNLKNFSKRTNTEKFANNLVGRSNGVTPVMLATESASFTKYGLWEDVVNLNQNAPNADALRFYTAAEYIFTSYPDVTYSVTPFPYTLESSIPEPFVDYEIGDQVYIKAKKEPRIDDFQLVRVFGINITIDEEGNEFVSELQIYYE